VSERAAALAAAFERANSELIELVEPLTAEQWRAITQAEGWPVAVTAHHVAVSHPSLFGLAQLVANGQEVPPITMEMIDAANAEHALEFAHVSHAETLDLLRREGAAVASGLRGLTDEQLARSAPMAFAGGQPWTAQELIERIVIHHPSEHGASIKATIG
jgi:hypothetical protein